MASILEEWLVCLFVVERLFACDWMKQLWAMKKKREKEKREKKRKKREKREKEKREKENGEKKKEKKVLMKVYLQ